MKYYLLQIFLLWLLLVDTICLVASATLSIRPINGEQLQEVAVGAPVEIDVIVTGIENVLPQIVLEAGEHIALKKTGYGNIRTNNGLSARQFMYQAIFDAPGIFHIGPAIVSIGTSKIKSNNITIRVGEKTITQKTSAHNKSGQAKDTKTKDVAATLQLSLDQERVYVGQRVLCTLMLQYQKGTIIPKQIVNQTKDLFKSQLLEGHQMHHEMVNGVQFETVSWQWYLYPEHAGKLILPACIVDVVVKDTKQISFLFRPTETIKRLYSNAVSIIVDPLPEGVSKEMPVGVFTEFLTNITPQTIENGRAATISYQLFGQANFQDLMLDDPENVPADFKCHKSVSAEIIDKDTNQVIGKRFEWILQPTQPGEFIIPTQKFAYFDPFDKKVKFLASQALPVAVAMDVPPMVDQSREDNTSDLHAVETQKSKMRLMQLPDKTLFVNSVAGYAVPWFIFYILALVPILTFLVFWWRWKCAFKEHTVFEIACTQLDLCKSHNDYGAIYNIFIQFFAKKTSYLGITTMQLQEYLKNLAVSVDLMVQWNIFWQQIHEYAFSNSVTNDETIFKRAQDWLSFWEQRL